MEKKSLKAHKLVVSWRKNFSNSRVISSEVKSYFLVGELRPKFFEGQFVQKNRVYSQVKLRHYLIILPADENH